MANDSVSPELDRQRFFAVTNRIERAEGSRLEMVGSALCLLSAFAAACASFYRPLVALALIAALAGAAVFIREQHRLRRLREDYAELKEVEQRMRERLQGWGA